jgi:hypothetical protein
MTVDVSSSGGGGGSSSGGGSGGSSAGTSGTSDYSTSDDTQTVSDTNGRWDSIEYIDQIRYTNLDTAILDPNNAQDVRYETGLTIRNETETGADYAVFFTLSGSPTQPSDGGVTVTLARVAPSGSQWNFAATPSAVLTTDATARLFNNNPYNGTNVLNPSVYVDPGTTFNDTADNITQNDNTSTRIIFSESTGRANITLWDRTLFTAVEPNPASLDTDDQGEFFTLHFRTPVNTTGWTVENETASLSLPEDELSGTVYFANDSTAFYQQWNLPPENVYDLPFILDETGDNLTLIDADGDRRDEVAFGDGSVTTSRDWYVDGLSQGDVANRSQSNEYLFDDRDGEVDWNSNSESTFFDVTPSNGVAFVDTDGSLASYSTADVVTNYGESPVAAVGPADTDFNSNSEPDVPFVQNGNLYVTETQAGTRNVDTSNSVIDASVATGTFEPSASTSRIYYIVDTNSNGNTNQFQIYRGEPVGNNNQVTSTNDNPTNVSGIADIDGDSNNELVYYNQNNNIQYLDDGTSDINSVGYTNSPASGDSVGTPAVFDSITSSQALIPIINTAGEIELVDNTGTVRETFTPTPAPEPASLGSFDIDGDTNTEIVYVEDSSPNQLVALNVNDGTTDMLQNQGGSDVTSGDATGGTK